MPVTHRFRDFALYLLIGIVLMGTVLYVAKLNPPLAVNEKWILSGLLTLIVFGYLINAFWNHRKSAKLWLTLTALLLFHCTSFGLLLAHTPKWSILTYIFVFTLECMFLGFLVYKILGFAPYAKQ